MSYGMVDGACAQAISDEAEKFFLRTSLGSLSIAQMVNVVCTDIAENTLPTPVLSNGIEWFGEALLMG